MKYAHNKQIEPCLNCCMYMFAVDLNHGVFRTTFIVTKNNLFFQKKILLLTRGKLKVNRKNISVRAIFVIAKTTPKEPTNLHFTIFIVTVQ